MPTKDRPERIAIVGVGGIFPGSPDLETFWTKIAGAVDSGRPVPSGRWFLSPGTAFDPAGPKADRVYSTWGCFVEDFRFDPTGLDLDKPLIDRLDPLFHLGLHAARDAVNDARQLNDTDRNRVGVILGNIALPTESTSALCLDVLGRTFVENLLDAASLSGADRDQLSFSVDGSAPRTDWHPLNRLAASLPAALIAQGLGLGGLAYTLDAACASSLYALKFACEELRSHRADAMLAGGMSRPDCQYTQMGFAQLKALSRQGRCAPLSAAADGLVVGEGAGIFVLKRLTDAIAADDRIYGIIAGIGLSNDRGANLLAPHSEGQLRAMRQAYDEVGWKPSDVDLIECHATGTPVGDSVEIASLQQLWHEEAWTPGQCVIGGVKSNVGHLLTGAGAAGLMKVIFALKHQTLPPTANFTTPAAALQDPSPFRVLEHAEPWRRRETSAQSSFPNGKSATIPRRATVNAFGFGGINAHVLIEEYCGIPDQISRHSSGKPEIATGTLERVISDIEPPGVPDLDIAVVGLAANVGSSNSETSRQFPGEQANALTSSNDWGATKTEWFRREFGFQREQHCSTLDPISEVRLPVGEFRIPPLEMQDMLPQQQFMLQVAADALRDSFRGERQRCIDAEKKPGQTSAEMTVPIELGNRTGVFVGIELDPNTTNFHLRWSIEELAPQWLQTLGLKLAPEETERWIADLKNSISPPLTANRVMGNLGGIVASRLAREFNVGGPSFTISSDENSGLRACALAAQALRRGELDRALVGAVDFPCDIRSLVAELRSDFVVRRRSISDGATAMVLKRLEDAIQDGDNIHAVIRTIETNYADVYRPGGSNAGMASGSTGDRELLTNRDASACQLDVSANRAKTHSGLSGLSSSSVPTINRTSVGAATGLVSLATHLMALSQKSLVEPSWHHWLRNRCDGPRRILVPGSGFDGKNLLFKLSEPPETDHERKTGSPSVPQCGLDRLSRPRFDSLPVHLLVIDGDSMEEIESGLRQLTALAEMPTSVGKLAHHWFHKRPPRVTRRLAMVFIVKSLDELPEIIHEGRKLLNSASDANNFGRRIQFSHHPVGHSGQVAFVFPGSGNAFLGMGRELLATFPEVLLRQDAENERLRDQYRPELVWFADSTAEVLEDHKAMIFGQVALGTSVCDLLQLFKVNPSASIGYSLGESAAFFGLGVWTDRDEMLQRMHDATLFGSDLVRPFDAARRAWDVPADVDVEWISGIVDRSSTEIRAKLGLAESTPFRGDDATHQTGMSFATSKSRFPRVYLLIVNTNSQCVIGGWREQVERFVQELNAQFVPFSAPSTVHCEILRQVEPAYRALHLMPTTPPAAPRSINFYSAAWGRTYDVTRESAADAIVAQAVATIDFPRVVRQAYTDGVRVFVEIGPGSSCSRMIDEILEGRPHFAQSAIPVTANPVVAFFELIAALIAQRVPVDLSYLYGSTENSDGEKQATLPPRQIVTRTYGSSFEIPTPLGGWPSPNHQHHRAPIESADRRGVEGPLGNKQIERTVAASPAHYSNGTSDEFSGAIAMTAPQTISEDRGDAVALQEPNVMTQWEDLLAARLAAHETYLRFSTEAQRLVATQIKRLQSAELHDTSAESRSSAVVRPQSESSSTLPSESPPRSLSREQCMEFAVGRIGNALGTKFSEIDRHPTRVRLPDEPLMLVDRILNIEGEPLSMSSGCVVTEHDIHPGAWYLDCNRIPTCIAVEAGQADLFLSGWLGIDLETKGLACYRLLDAVVTFHDHLPQPNQVIHYNIRINHFFRQGQTYLFRFEFDATVDGKPLLTMREGCAGFFTEGELASGKGIVHTSLDRQPRPGKRPSDWSDLVPMTIESYDDARLIALRRGELDVCFGPAFRGLPIRDPVTLPGLASIDATGTSNHQGTEPAPNARSRMWLIDRVLKLDPSGGKFGIGMILGELDIHPDDWFITCHFCDDQVMPGTLMYECCLHTLRIYLLRMGWIGENTQVVYEPVPGIRSRLKCRGQVRAHTKKVWYEITLKEIGYTRTATDLNDKPVSTAEGNPTVEAPYCLADALMYADGKPIVEITDMSVQLSGLTQRQLQLLWNHRSTADETPGMISRIAASTANAGASPVEVVRYDRRTALFDTERITAFAIGNPSAAFGDRYRAFDFDRIIARLPGPPFQFLDRIVAIEGCEPWILRAGGQVVAQYDVPQDAWYFASNRQPRMPFAVLLETALQPCGWLAAYVGSALTSETDLSFRNLGGTATQFREVTPTSGTLTTTVRMTRVSHSGGMIIQHYDFDLRCQGEPVYVGNTYFGFFSKSSLENQIGIRDARPFVPTAADLIHANRFRYIDAAPFADARFQMIDDVQLSLQGGPAGHGFAVGTMTVDPGAWFFKAHFHQDPVVPGSLGLESFFQLLKFYAAERWQLDRNAQFMTPTIAPRGTSITAKHEWIYRGQVIPRDRRVTVSAVVSQVDDTTKELAADGFLSVDGRVIYQMKDFSLGALS